MKNNKVLVLVAILANFFSTQAHAIFFVTTNNSKVEISGSANDSASGAQDSYQNGAIYSSTAIPLYVTQDDFLEGEALITGVTALSSAELDLGITHTSNGYRIMGTASSYADTEISSLADNDADAKGDAVVDLAFTLTSDYSFAFTSSLFDADSAGESEVELISDTTGAIIFSQTVSEGALNPAFSGSLVAGDYTLFIGALAEAFDGDFASADLEYNLQLTSVPLPAGLPLFLSGLVALGFKSRTSHKANI